MQLYFDGTIDVSSATLLYNLKALMYYLPVKSDNLLHEPRNCEKFGIYSIMDPANGITLCSECHQCFDRNLVYIDPETGKLFITDGALLVYAMEGTNG